MIFTKDIWRSGTIEPVRVKYGCEFLTENIKNRLQSVLESKYMLNVTVFDDKIKSDMLFNKSIKECICIKNNDHTDYNFHVITSSKQGKYCIFKFYMGASEKSRKVMKNKQRRNEEIFYYAMVDESIKEGLL